MLEQIELSALAAHIGETWWFPLLESIHVVVATFLVGALLMIDLRLLNAAAMRYSVERIVRELVPWVWGAFALAALTGAGLFITRATSYIANTAMQMKLLLLALAGVNMLVLHFTMRRARLEPAPTRIARIAGATSLMLWVAVMLSGRWIGHLS